jgi:hypothetical protein
MVAFRDLWTSHPVNESVQTPCIAPRDLTSLEGKAISKGYPVFSNQCAIRMGVSLKRAGVVASQITGCTHCEVHSREEMHFINARQLADALTRARIAGIDPRERFLETDVNQFYPRLFGRTGVIYIQDYWRRNDDPPGQRTGDHIDVWNGYRSSTKWLMEWFSWAGYYSNYAGAKEIWFWPVR